MWGPGTFGYSKLQLESFKVTQCPGLNMDKITFDTENHGKAGGDNYGEGNLDVQVFRARALFYLVQTCLVPWYLNPVPFCLLGVSWTAFVRLVLT